MRVLILLICFVLGQASFSQTLNYEKGTITSNIVVDGTNNESFELYLPSTYNPEILSAIVFIFDPSGNGNNGLKPFLKSAEAYNYILVCSNNSKNGPYEQNFDITNRLFAHVFANFNIDEKQLYTAGFSGGSRLACTIAVLTKAIQGVIGCGAGMAIDMQNKPNSESTFSYAGLVGDEDMNYQEMFNVKKWFDKLKIDNELFTYEDGHNWPPESQIQRAFKWFELQAYQKKLRPVNKEAVQMFYAEDLTIADSLTMQQPIRGVMEYERMIRNYGAYKNLDSIKKKLDALKSSDPYKKELKIRNRIEEEEYTISEEFLTKFRKEYFVGRSGDRFTWWKKQLKNLDESILKHDDVYTIKMGKRLRYRLRAVAYESSFVSRNENNLDRMLYCDQLLVHLQPDQPYFYYRLAETYSQKNDPKKTLYNLEKAIDLGYKNLNSIKYNPKFAKFKKNKKFGEFLRSIDD